MQNSGCTKAVDLSWRGGKQDEKTPGSPCALWFLRRANLAEASERTGAFLQRGGMISTYVHLTFAVCREDRHGEPIGRPAGRLRRSRHWPWTREPSRLAGRAVNASCFKSSTPRSFRRAVEERRGVFPKKLPPDCYRGTRLHSRRRDAVQSGLSGSSPRAPSLRPFHGPIFPFRV